MIEEASQVPATYPRKDITVVICTIIGQEQRWMDKQQAQKFDCMAATCMLVITVPPPTFDCSKHQVMGCMAADPEQQGKQLQQVPGIEHSIAETVHRNRCCL